ncbi:methionine ABC transporter substrate-binding protein [Marinobacter vulgaris]|uniref:Methionine ABC transporter substrate-binding protein n=1 Tax=Marinobacter vulgaris TaxID=1928331 RepID=A0A2V3ZNF9_9GAMM|nr:MetQ/NlpA family ABC transporter substrate-binding protein [Marinobacter vulgaris]PXX92511.1 methionine ABC transporter substrate-binding protein [Marinobacter vulgaris]TSJ71544.1 ABC transporter substrate-binding protein [Marinobacter vulgaris]
MNLKKTLVGLAAAATFAGAVSAEELSVAATPVPHAEILEFVKPKLAEQGVELDVKVFTDYVQPNVQVDQKRMDANFFQHQPYLDEFNVGRGTNLVSVVGVHVEPFGAYSSRIDSLDELEDGATIAIPNDPTNGGRALLLLQKAGLITLEDDSKITATPRDIADNPRNLDFKELEAATLPRILNQVDLALINTNYALEAGLNPTEDALVIEGAESPYVNILVAHEDRADEEAIQKLAEALTSEDVKQFIEENYQGAVVPAF